MTFPGVSGFNLLGKKLNLPQDFQGKLNLIFIAFEQWQQMEIDSWKRLVPLLEGEFESLATYELPIIHSRNPLFKIFQVFHNEGMRAGIPNPKNRENTIPLYLDKAQFRRALALQGEEHTAILVVDRDGKEFFRADGPYDPDVEIALRGTLRQLDPIKQR